MITTLPIVHYYWLSHELVQTADEHGDAIGWTAQVRGLIDFAEPLCESLQMDRIAFSPIYNIRVELEHFGISGKFDEQEVRRELKTLRANIEIVLSERQFAYVLKDRTGYVSNEKPLGQEVFDAFKAARFDLKEASDALAIGLNTSAAFHMMRASEVALWELGRDRQIPSVSKIEFMEWGKIIDELETEVEKIQQWPNSVSKEDAHQFYNRLLVEIRAFNDGYRRHIAHVRRTQLPLDPEETLALFGHVKRFFETMAPMIQEGNYTPITWY